MTMGHLFCYLSSFATFLAFVTSLMFTLTKLHARELLDSRGNPTIEVEIDISFSDNKSLPTSLYQGRRGI